MQLIKFWMDGCAPCNALSMALEHVDHHLVDTMKDVNINDEPELAMKYQLRSVPVMLIVDEHGSVIKRHNGAMSLKEIEEFLKV